MSAAGLAQPMAVDGPRAIRSGPRRTARRAWGLMALVLLVAAIAGGATYMLVERDPGSEQAALPTGKAAVLTAAELRQVASDSPHPLFWAGERPGSRLEVTRGRGGNLYVRYLTGDAPVGDRRPAYTTVGSYPVEDAYSVLASSAKRRGMELRPAAGGGKAAWDPTRPSSIYFAFPGSDVLVEVYEPDAARARALIRSGELGPIR